MYSILNKRINLRQLSRNKTSKQDEHFIGVNMITEKPTKATHKSLYISHDYEVLKTQCVVFELYHDCNIFYVYVGTIPVPSHSTLYSISISYYYCLLLFYDTKENVYQSNYFSEL